MANRFIGGVLSSRPQANTPFVSRASTGTYFDQTGTLITAPINQPRLNRNFTGQLSANRYSALFTSASTNYLSAVTAASALGTGNFTMEFWWKANSTVQSNYSNIINQGFTGSPSNGAFSFKVYSTSNILNFTYYNNGISDNSTSANVNDLAWHHIAASRNGTSLGIYVDGALNTTITLPASFNMGASGGTTYIGYNPRDASYINGHVKDLRLITGQALYSGTFTPPTAPLTTTSVGSTGSGAAATLSGTVILLTCQTASLNDVSSNNYAITNTNAVTSSLLLPNNLGIDTSGTGWTQPSVLIEPTATNGHPRSQNFTVSPWNTEYATVTNNNGIAPDGTSTAATFIPTAVNNFHRTAIGWTSVTGYGNGVWTTSMFVKAYGYSFVSLRFDDGVTSVLGTTFNLSGNGSTSTGYYDANTAAGTPLSSSITPVGNGWYRIAITTRVLVFSNVGLYFHVMSNATTTSFTADGSSGVYIWGTQVEQGYGTTSYIPTAGSAVTRAADIVGPYSSGIYKLEDRQNSTAIDDQFTVQSFTSLGSTTWTAPLDVTSVEVLVVGGGGGANNSSGGNSTGGGGGGGVIYNTNYPVVPGVAYPIIIGAGGTPAASNSVNPLNGGNSQFGALIAIGGGGGAGRDPNTAGCSGGSGGGGNTYGSAGGRGITGQGYPGGIGVNYSAGVSGGGGGGGGAAGPGGNAVVQAGGVNGPGLGLTISGTLVYYGAGGVGQSTGGSNTTAVAGGTASNTNGAANTGAGGAGGSTNNGTSIGGSGVVIVKYKRTPRQISSVSNAAIVTQRFTTTISAGWTAPVGVTQVEVLTVAGGGGGGGDNGGGGGAGGLIYNSAFSVTPGSTYTVTVGSGGAGGGNSVQGTNGTNSVFGSLTATGGGGGGGSASNSGLWPGLTGGSGGGGGGNENGSTGFGVGGAGTSLQGNAGGNGANAGASGATRVGGGGGGAGSAGSTASVNGNTFGYSGLGGAGLPYSITGNLEYYAGGGGGGGQNDTGGVSMSIGYGGVGGGGNGAAVYNGAGTTVASTPAAPNTGGGGGGGGRGANSTASAGGSGVVIIRYRVPTVATFLDSGSWTCPSGVTSVQALVVAGGGGGASGGGGAGGVLYSSSVAVTPGVTYPIFVGQGGAGGLCDSGNAASSVALSGGNSNFANLIAIGGGRGANTNGTGGSFWQQGGPGGSGGGAAADSGGTNLGGAGTYSQGNAGGGNGGFTTSPFGVGGGGGAGAAALTASSAAPTAGGAGLAFSISGSSVTYAGGGGGGNYGASAGGTGGTGGGGSGGTNSSNGTAATQNTGGGGGGSGSGRTGGAGGSGIVILRWSGA